ncbi:MAG: hypothetical protein HZA46_21220 [Planctomycetales bacterium]|nr:hypothetical protein [Planctomycetales bacterium]
MADRIERQNDRGPISRPLLSRSTILILSGILVGMGLRDGLEHQLYLAGYFSGAVGIIAYFGLEVLAQRRQREATRETLQRAATVLNSWLAKEVGEGCRSSASSDAIPVLRSGIGCQHSGSN